MASAKTLSQEALRTTMIETQLKPSGITNPRTSAAFFNVPREDFVLPDQRYLAYAEAEPFIGSGRQLMLPRSIGQLVERADIQPTEKVLVVGAGTGYTTAILAGLAAHVTALESDSALAGQATELLRNWGNTKVVTGPLTDGWAKGAPYSFLFLNGSIEEFPEALAGQVAQGGRVAAIIRKDGASHAALGYRSGEKIVFQPFADATAPALPGFDKAPVFSF